MHVSLPVCISALNLHKHQNVAGEVWTIYKEALSGGTPLSKN